MSLDSLGNALPGGLYDPAMGPLDQSARCVCAAQQACASAARTRLFNAVCAGARHAAWDTHTAWGTTDAWSWLCPCCTRSPSRASHTLYLRACRAHGRAAADGLIWGCSETRVCAGHSYGCSSAYACTATASACTSPQCGPSLAPDAGMAGLLRARRLTVSVGLKAYNAHARQTSQFQFGCRWTSSATACSCWRRASWWRRCRSAWQLRPTRAKTRTALMRRLSSLLLWMPSWAPPRAGQVGQLHRSKRPPASKRQFVGLIAVRPW